MFATLKIEHPQQVKQALDHFGVIWLGEMEKIVSRDLDSDLKLDPGLLVLRGNSFKVSPTLPLRGRLWPPSPDTPVNELTW